MADPQTPYVEIHHADGSTTTVRDELQLARILKALAGPGRRYVHMREREEPIRVPKGRVLSRAVVRIVLIDAGIVFSSTLHGFEMQRPASQRIWRLQHGGGISGDGDRVWWLATKSGQSISRRVTTPSALRQLVKDWYAGKVP